MRLQNLEVCELDGVRKVSKGFSLGGQHLRRHVGSRKLMRRAEEAASRDTTSQIRTLSCTDGARNERHSFACSWGQLRQKGITAFSTIFHALLNNHRNPAVESLRQSPTEQNIDLWMLTSLKAEILQVGACVDWLLMHNRDRFSCIPIGQRNSWPESTEWMRGGEREAAPHQESRDRSNQSQIQLVCLQQLHPTAHDPCQLHSGGSHEAVKVPTDCLPKLIRSQPILRA